MDIDDASHGNRSTSYGQEGCIQLLVSDYDLGYCNRDLDTTEANDLSRPAHLLVASSSRSGRISHSTSHGETLAGVRGMQTGQMLAMRFTEVYFEVLFNTPRSYQMMLEVERLGAFMVPVDHITDCYELF